ncbi:MAG: alkaline phosphatase, partial [Candidatus Poribacteria bacterium]|nr:alkaline phosphatase [Candidatus Poribacteria bacterium]
MRHEPNLPKNVIFCIGDGMGFEKVKAAGMYAHGDAGTLSFEAFPNQGEVTTHSADSSMTDSAAAATALATGVKVNNGVVSIALPGDGRKLYTLLEHFRDQGKSTGLVSTTFITHATPAAFGAHNPSRGNLEEIACDYLNYTRPNVLFGGGANGMSVAEAEAANYSVVTDRHGLLTLDTKNLSHVSGQFGDSNLPYEYDGLGDLPHLSEMTATAMDILVRNPVGFFLMIEGGRIDHAGHLNDIERNVCETIEFSKTLKVVMD